MPGTGKKMLMWLGLADAEEYDDYEPYEEVPVPQPQAATARRGGEVVEAFPQTSPAVRTLPRDGQDPVSYTHLDVYKRQLPYVAGASTPGGGALPSR